MTVKALITKLQAEDPNRIVIMSSDSEGNRYSPLSSVNPFRYLPDSTWSGEIYNEDDEELPTGTKAALVLYPTN
jgi:hypothetical protein